MLLSRKYFEEALLLFLETLEILLLGFCFLMSQNVTAFLEISLLYIFFSKASCFVLCSSNLGRHFERKTRLKKADKLGGGLKKNTRNMMYFKSRQFRNENSSLSYLCPFQGLLVSGVCKGLSELESTYCCTVCDISKWHKCYSLFPQTEF